MANICRLCGNNEDQTIFIFGNEALKHHIDLKIRVGLDIPIFPDDPLPKYACVCCLGKLDDFWTFLHHCRKVQTNLRRLLPVRVSFQFHDIIRDELQKSKASTEESSPHIKVLETLVVSTGNDVNDSGYMNPNNNSKVEVDKVKVEADSNENSNDSFHSSNELCGNECEPFENDPYFIDRDLLVTPQNCTSLAAGQLDSYYQGREENMAFSAAGFTSQSAPEYNPVTVEMESEVQANRASKKTDLINTVPGLSETTLSAKDNNANFQSISDRPQDPLLMEELTLELPNTVLSTTSILTVAEEGLEDKRSNDTFSVNNDLNQNRLQAPNMIAQSSHYLTTANKGCDINQMTNTCGFLDNNFQPLSLMEEQPSKNRNQGTDGTEVISTVVVNIVSKNEKEVDCDSVFNTLRSPLLKGEVACKTTSPATDTCSQNTSIHEVNDEEVPQGDGGDFSQHSVMIADLPLNHANYVGSGMTNVSSGIEDSSDDNPRYLLGKVCNTIPQVTGKLSRNTEFVLNGLAINGDCQPLQVMHSDADIADMSDQNMETSGRVSDLIGTFPVTIENEVHQTQQLNTACSDSNTNHESKDHSIIVNSGNSDICVHGVDATVCIYTRCCASHPFDKYVDNVGSRFRCLLCEYSTRDKYIIRAHVCAHVPLKLFECSICCKKFRLFQKLSLHIITHSRKVDRSGGKECDEYSCENCSKTFETNSDLQYHEIKMCEIRSVSCPECGFLFSSLEKHKFRCFGKTGHLVTHTETRNNGDNKGESQPLEVIHSEADIAVISDQNMESRGKVSVLKGSVAVTSENEVHPSLQSNIASCSNSNTSRENKPHSMIVNSGNSAICAHGINATVCIYTKCCVSHQFDKYWIKGALFHCLLCEYFTRDKYNIRAHVCAHVPFKLFQCSICYKKFRLFQKLSLHIMTHSRKVDGSGGKECGEYSCENCSKTFETNADLQYHQTKMCEIRSVSCPECGFLFSSLEQHKFRCSGKTGFVCNICNESYMVKKNLIQHLRTHEQREYACDKCKKMYSTSQSLYTHQKSKHDTPKFKCTYCPSSFYFKSLFEKHLVTHTGTSNYGESQPLKVINSDADIAVISDQNMKTRGKVSDLKDSVAVTSEKEVHQSLQINTASCSDSNTSRENKDDSMIVNSENSAKCVHGIDANMCIYLQCCISSPFDKYWNKLGSVFRCLLCQSVTRGVTSIRRHVSAHVALNIFECSICYNRLRSYESLTKHMTLHSRKHDRSSTKACGVYTCKNCSQTFKTISNLRSHEIRTCMIGSSSCPDCGLRFSALKKHRLRCPGKTGFICDICNKSFYRKGQLRKHLRTHEQGEFACDKCEKIYSNSRLLRTHQNAEHGAGKFKCTYCTKTFCNNPRLEAHVVSHTGIRNYLCEICSKTFLNSGNLVTHMKFHGKKDLKCHFCGNMYFRKNMLQSHMKNVHCK